MKLLTLFLMLSFFTISCYAACNSLNTPSPQASPGFFLYKNDEYISNMSTIYRCNHCESQCSINTALWCIRRIPINSSMESMNTYDYTFDYNVSVEWIEPTPSQTSPQYLSSQVNHQLCLCSLTTGASPCNSSRDDEGVYKCIVKGSNVTETLQFTYSVYKLTTVTSTGKPSTPSNVIITSSFYRTMGVSTTTLLSTETTTTKTITNIPSIDTLCSLCSLHATACPSSNQNSTLPYYSGIGLLATTNLLTFIVLVTGCVYIIYSKKQTKYALGRSRANITVLQSNPIGSLSVINIETEIRNEDYDSCSHKRQQEQQQQQQQQQQESSHPSIDIYSYAVDDEDCTHSTADDNDEYAVPDDLFEMKRKGSNPPPSVPPPYAGKGITMVEETVNGVGNSSSVDNLDCLYALIGSKGEEKEQAS